MRTRHTSSSSHPAPPNGSRTPRAQAEFGEHVPVLLHEAINALNIHASDTVVDATLGGAGHAREIVKLLGEKGTLIGIDADSSAIGRAREALVGSSAKVELIQGNFRDLSEILDRLDISSINSALFDFGWSAYQLASGRGFSFQKDEPLLMTYSDSVDEKTLTAMRIVNDWEEGSIADVLWGWGEEKFARRIARAIVEKRKEKKIETSRSLADIVLKAVPAWYRHKKIHLATKTFQALRIAVNDEMGAIQNGLAAARTALRKGGRIAAITFHSVEDREVKRIFRGWQKEGIGNAEKIVRPNAEEVNQNPRSRSAKLRIFIKK